MSPRQVPVLRFFSDSPEIRDGRPACQSLPVPSSFFEPPLIERLFGLFVQGRGEIFSVLVRPKDRRFCSACFSFRYGLSVCETDAD